MWTFVQDSRSAHGLLYLVAVRDDRYHLIRSDLQPVRFLLMRALTCRNPRG
jgi:hypothetical protein